MGTSHFKQFAVLGSAVVFATLTTQSFAATTWNLSNSCTSMVSGQEGVQTTQTVQYKNAYNTSKTATYVVDNVGNKLNCGVGTSPEGKTSSLSVSAFSTASVAGTASNYTQYLTAGTQFANASARLYSGNGVGVVNQFEDANSPTHTADNQNGTDVLLLNFGATKFNLNSLEIGWWAKDYDITLLAYTGSGSPEVAGKTLASDFTTAKGWTSIKNYGSSGTTTESNPTGTSADDKTLTSTDSTTYSSWWMVSAYNTNFNGGNSLGTDTISDFFKLATVVGTAETTNKTPEPTSLALMGAAMMGFVATRRRKQKSA